MVALKRTFVGGRVDASWAEVEPFMNVALASMLILSEKIGSCKKVKGQLASDRMSIFIFDMDTLALPGLLSSRRLAS